MIPVRKNEMIALRKQFPDLEFVATRHHFFIADEGKPKRALNVMRNTGVKCRKHAKNAY